MLCQKCSHEVTDTDKFCSQCGSADPAANAEWLNKVQERMNDPVFRKRVEEEAKSMLEMKDDNYSEDPMDDPEYQKWEEEMSILNAAVQEEMDRLSGVDNTKKMQRRKWKESEVNQLMKEYESGWLPEKMAAAHERTEDDVIAKLLTVLLFPDFARRLEPWSDEEESDFASEYTSGITLDEIAKKHRRSLLAVAIRAAKFGADIREILARIKKEQKK